MRSATSFSSCLSEPLSASSACAAARSCSPAFCLSAAIEITQLFIPGRTTSSDDVLCNTLGAVVGLLLVSSRVGVSRGFLARVTSVESEDRLLDLLTAAASEVAIDA